MSEGIRPEFYRIDSSRFSFREYWWGSKNPLILLIAAVIKLSRQNSGGSTDDPAVESLVPFQIAHPLPPEMTAKFAPLEAELLTLGFHSPIFHVIDDPLNFSKYYWATFRHHDGRSFARIHCRVWQKVQPPRVHLFPYFVTLFQDGTFLYSSSGKPDTELPANVQAQRLYKKSTPELWRAHQGKLNSATKSILPINSEGALVNAAESFHIAARDFNLQRGAFKPVADYDAKELEIINQTRVAAEALGSQNADVLAEIELLQKAPRRWRNSIWLLIISGIAFVAASRIQNSWEFALLLIPILLFHELGHYLAMYIFKYRNLRMFFIPFLGAAVTGQNYNVAAWKKLVVFLMGPLPGIGLGCALAAAGMFRENQAVTAAGGYFIFINAFNLLPLLPFDGGHVVGLILFSRHYILDAVFRVLAALGMLILGFALQANVLIILGFFSLFAVGASFKIANATEKIRDRKIPMSTVDGGDHISPESADVIITELKKQFTKPIPSKVMAQHVLTVFETLNTTPPKWLASIFFLGLHGGAFLFSALALFLIYFQSQGGLNPDLYENVTDLPVKAAEIQVHNPESAKHLNRTNSAAIVATFNKAAKAKEAYHNAVNNSLSNDGQAVLFSHTVYLRVPATNTGLRTQLFETLSMGTTNLFVERTNYTSSFSFLLVVMKPNLDKPWFKQFEEFLGLPLHEKLIPPWTPKPLLPREEWADYERARHTYHLLNGPFEEEEKESVADSKDYQKEFVAAMRVGDTEKIKALQEKSQERQKLRQERRMASIKQKPSSEIHEGVLTNHMEYPANTNQLAAYRASLAKTPTFLGTYKESHPEIAPYAIRSGYMFKSKSIIKVQHLHFEDFVHGGPRFLTWLADNGVTEVSYGVMGYASGFDDEINDVDDLVQ